MVNSVEFYTCKKCKKSFPVMSGGVIYEPYGPKEVRCPHCGCVQVVQSSWWSTRSLYNYLKKKLNKKSNNK